MAENNLEANIMAKEDKFSDEMLNDDELDKVTGGTIAETAADSFDLYRRGLVEDIYVGSNRTHCAINAMGFKYKDHGGLFRPNEYFNHLGKPVSRGKFWEDFDKQHQTEAVPVIDVIRDKISENMEKSLAQEKIFCPA